MKVNTDHKLSIFHFNSRSLYANFQSIKDYLSKFKKPFNIIAITETWLSSEKDMDFDLNGYEMTYMNRKNKSGGGVALYVENGFKYKVVESMTTAVDDLLECVTKEICMGKKRKM